MRLTVGCPSASVEIARIRSGATEQAVEFGAAEQPVGAASPSKDVGPDAAHAACPHRCRLVSVEAEAALDRVIAPNRASAVRSALPGLSVGHAT